MKHVSIVAIPHPFFEDLYLHGKRKDTGKWALPGGHGEDGETPDETARRELKEETSLDIKEMEECRNGGFVGQDEDPFKVFLFRAPAQESLTVDPTADPDGEFSEFGFIDPLKNKDLHVAADKNLLVHYLRDNEKIAKFEQLEKSLVFEADSTEPHREVWRVQNEKGQGPYYGADERVWRDAPHLNDTHPTPHSDPGFNDFDLNSLTDFHSVPRSARSETPVFGFESEDHLRKWFSPTELVRLGRLGFKPTKIKARKVWSSGRQAFFLPHHDEIQKSWTGELPGAVPQPKGPHEIPPHKLREGMAVEKEHSKDPKIQAEIAVAHYNESENYYPKLRQVEGETGPRDKLRKLIRKA